MFGTEVTSSEKQPRDEEMFLELIMTFNVIREVIRGAYSISELPHHHPIPLSLYLQHWLLLRGVPGHRTEADKIQ